MKPILLIICLAVSSHNVFAQTWEEWVRQKKTQIKYLHQQIAAYAVYGARLSEGYTIASKGLNVIGNRKEGEYSLHDDFFTRLGVVNNNVKDLAEISDILRLQTQIAKSVGALDRLIAGNIEFTRAERAHLKKVLGNLVRDCLQDMEVLITTLSDGAFQMSDEERIHRVLSLRKDLEEKWVFVRSLSGKVQLLLKGKQREKNDVELSKLLNGLR